MTKTRRLNTYEPMYAGAGERPFSSKDWIFELKWDSIRTITYTQPQLNMITARNKDISKSFPEFTELSRLNIDMVLDGELVIMTDGKLDHETLKKRVDASEAETIQRMAKTHPSTYVVFDILEKDKKPLINEPLIFRKETLRSSIRPMDHVRLSIYADEKGEPYFGAALKEGFDAIVAKHKLSPYEPGKTSRNWLEIRRNRGGSVNSEKRTRLKEYNEKRNFLTTDEPRGHISQESLSFVVQEHHARRLHYDFRLAREGVLKSWAVPKGIPERAGIRRLAIQVEDHPLEYANFEGTIPEGQYGAGTVKIWDKGSYELKVWQEDKIEFRLKGTRLSGRYVLVRLKKGKSNNWLIMRMKE